MSEHDEPPEAIDYSVDLVRVADPVLAAMSEGVVLQAADGRIVGNNEAALEILGLSEAELLGRTGTHPDWRALDADGRPLSGEDHPAMRSIACGAPLRGVVMGVVRPGGERRWLRVNTTLLTPSQGLGEARVMSTFVDITREREATVALAHREAVLQALFDHAGVGIFLTDRGERIGHLNATWRKLSGLGLGDDWTTCVATEDRARVALAWKQLVYRRVRLELELELAAPDGRTRLVELTANPVSLEDEHLGFIVTATDLSAEQQLLRERERFFDSSPDLRCMASVDGRLLRVNRAFELTLGWSAMELTQSHFLDFVHPDDVEATEREMARLAAGEPSSCFENRYLGKDGQWRWLSWACPAPEPGEDVLYAVARDITHVRQESERLAREARTDALTGLLNRGGLLAEAGARGGAEASFGLVFVDLDQFKPINDRYGHTVGDEVLEGVAQRLREAVRRTDIVGRLGGDEFLVLLPGADRTVAPRVVDALRDALSAPFRIAGHTLHVSASIGVAYCPAGESLREAITRADAAMYDDKAQNARALVTEAPESDALAHRDRAADPRLC